MNLWSSWRARLALACASVVVGMAGCRRDDVPSLLQVSDVTPHVVDVGETVEITGADFPVKRPGRVTFRGVLARAGEPPDESFATSVEGEAKGPAVIDITLTEALRARFCGYNGGSHATFRGDVEVAFAPLTPGSFPVVGVLQNVVIDVYPARPRRAEAEARRADAERALTAMGLRFGDGAGGDGLVVSEVEAGGPAELAGVAVGDLATSLDGVRLLAPDDAVPSGRQRHATLALRRPGGEAVERQVALRNFKPRRAADLVGVAVVLGFAAACAAFFASPAARSLTRLVNGRGAGAGRRFGGSALVRMAVWLRGGAGEVAPGGARQAAGCVAASAVLCALPFARTLLVEDVDATTLFLVGVVAATVLAVVARGPRAGASFVARCGVAARVVALQVPAAVAVGCVVALTGSLRVGDVVLAQGGAPWQWYAFQTPFAPLLFALVCAPALLDPAGAGPALPEAATSVRGGREAAGREFVGAATFLLCGAGAALFLGGWRLPGIDGAEQRASVALQVLGALVFLAKAWALALFLSLTRAVVPRLGIEQVGPVVRRALGPAAVAGAVLTCGWLAWDPDGLSRRTLAYVTFGAVVIFGVHAARRLAAGARAAVHVNPFV